MNCNNCGNELNDEAVFCSKCGQPLTNSDSLNYSTNQKPKKIKKSMKKGLKVFLWIIGVFVILFVAVIVWAIIPVPMHEAGDYVGIWQVVGSKDDISDELDEFGSTENKRYIVILDDETMLNAESEKDDMIVFLRKTEYDYDEGHLEVELENPEKDNDHIRFILDSENNLAYSEWNNDGHDGKYFIANLMEGDPEDFLLNVD